MKQPSRRNNLIDSIGLNKPISLDKEAHDDSIDKESNEELIQDKNENSHSQSSSDKQAKGKKSKADFILNILDKDVTFDIRKTKYVTADMANQISLLSTLTGQTEQVIMHSILKQFFKENESNMKQLMKDFL